MNPELINYVANARKSGLADADIKQNLLNHGWQAFDVEAAIAGTSAGPAVPSASTAAANQTLMAVLAYLGVLIIIPFLMAKDNPFVKFHLKQGLSIIIVWVAYWMFTSILALMHMGLFNFLIYPIVGIGLLILEIMGIVNAVQGQQKELPIIGSLAHKFNF